MTDVKGQKFPIPNIVVGTQTRSYTDYQGRKVKHLQPLKLKDGEWALAYSNRSYNLANDIVKKIGEAAPGLGMSFEGEPIFIEIPNDRDLE